MVRALASLLILVAASFESNGEALAIQPDGKIILAGSRSENLVSTFALARYNADGSLDQGFGTAGKVVIPLGGVGLVEVYTVNP